MYILNVFLFKSICSAGLLGKNFFLSNIFNFFDSVIKNVLERYVISFPAKLKSTALDLSLRSVKHQRHANLAQKL